VSALRVGAVSEAARIFAEENFAIEDWQGIPSDFVADWRPARDLVEQLVADGFNVRGEDLQ
jgi:hypothetical protein